VTTARLDLTRLQILAFRRHVGGLDERLPSGRDSLRRAAWAGLQDSMPRAALLSIHARVEGTGLSAWEDPSLVQLWGPRFNVFVVAARDLAARLHGILGGARMTCAEAGRALGVHSDSLRYAAATGTVVIRWDGARQPAVWTVPPPEAGPRDARLELACRYLHIYGPATPEAFGRWAGIGRRPGAAAFEALRTSLTLVQTPVGDAWILAQDEAAFRAAPGPVAPARLLPSGDAYLLLQGRDAVAAEAESLPLPSKGRRIVVRWATRNAKGFRETGIDVIDPWQQD
jgi:hypothetical protein